MQRTQVIVTVLDDLDLRGDLETPAEVQHVLALDGHEVKLDLSGAHSKELTDFLAPYLTAGETTRRPGKPYKPKNEMGAQMAESRRINQAAREWAATIGRPVPKRTATKQCQQLREDYLDARSKGLTP